VRLWHALLLACCALTLDARASTEFTIITVNGGVSFVAEDDWPVLTMQTKLPVAVVGFQLPNVADSDTPHSTSIALVLYDLKSEQGQRAFMAFPPIAGKMSPTVMKWGGWTVTRQQAADQGAEYTILDAKNPHIGEVAASARLAWPHLKANAPMYDRNIELQFRKFLESVTGKIGPHIRQDGEVIRRPSQ
jgi:hypothetical protein